MLLKKFLIAPNYCTQILEKRQNELKVYFTITDANDLKTSDI